MASINSINELVSKVESIKGGVFTRVKYKSDLKLLAEFKDKGISVVKVAETTIRFANYGNLASVRERKENEPKIEPKAPNYKWVVKDRIKEMNSTGNMLLMATRVPNNSNYKATYYITDEYGNVTESDTFDYSMCQKRGKGGEVFYVNVNNILEIGGESVSLG